MGRISKDFFMSKKSLVELLTKRNEIIEDYKQEGFRKYNGIFKSLK